MVSSQTTPLSVKRINTHACGSTWNSLHWFKFYAHFLGGRGARVEQWWEDSSPSNVARVEILVSMPHVGWLCCWFSPLSTPRYSGYSGFPLSLKTYTFKIPIRSGTQKYISTSSHELLSALWVNELQLQFQRFLSQFNFCFSLF